MLFGLDFLQLAFVVLVGVAVGGCIVALVYPMLVSSETTARLRMLTGAKRPAGGQAQSLFSGLAAGAKDSRRKQVQESLRQIEEKEKQRKKRVTVRMMVLQAGLDMPVRNFWLISLGCGLALFLLPVMFGIPWYIALLSAVAGFLGVPRWFLGYLKNRRHQAFVNDFADAIDVMVRGLKAGLPVSDAMKVIASEFSPPIGPEFMEVVEGQRVGITIEQGLERMFERVPLPEVNFLYIVMSIQSKTGGNLSETLSNLSRVLRDRKKMKGKIRSMAQEAKSSAAIIGALPFVIMGMLSLLNPGYLMPLFNTLAGNLMLGGSAIWMLFGVLVMRKLIAFDI